MSEPTNEIVKQLAVELSVVAGPTPGLITLTETGLILSDDISREQWREVVRVLKMAKATANLWLADAISFARLKWGEDECKNELTQLELDMPQVKAAIAIDTVPRELRLPGLNSDHMVELSKADNKKSQIKWARIASEQGLTPSQLRFSIIENEVVDKAATKMLRSGVVTIQGIRQSFDVWIRRVGGIAGVQDMALDHQEEIMGELSEIVEFGIQLQASLEPEPIIAAGVETD